MRVVLPIAAAGVVGILALMSALQAQVAEGNLDPIARDYKLLEGKWELLHGNEGKGPPTIRSVKEVKGDRETLRRYNIAENKLIHEHTVEFTLRESGDVRVFTFYPVGGDPDDGHSFVYKLDADDFYDIPGLLQGGEYRNYQAKPTIWHWKRVKDENRGGGVEKKADAKSESQD